MNRYYNFRLSERDVQCIEYALQHLSNENVDENAKLAPRVLNKVKEQKNYLTEFWNTLDFKGQ